MKLAIKMYTYIALSGENNWKLPLLTAHTSGNALYAITE